MEKEQIEWLSKGSSFRRFQVNLLTTHGKLLVKVTLEQHDKNAIFYYVEGCGVSFQEAWDTAISLSKKNSGFQDRGND